MANDDSQQLRQQLTQLTAQAVENERMLGRFFSLELALMECSSLGALLTTLVETVKHWHGPQGYSVMLFDPEQSLRECLQEQMTIPHVHFCDELTPLLRAFPEGRTQVGRLPSWLVTWLFPDTSALVGSCAAIPLLRHQRVIGCISFADAQVQHFSADQATDFLDHFAAVMAVCIENVLNHEHLRRLSLLDPLTRVHNRRSCEQRMQEMLAAAQRERQWVACCFVDIDWFKQVNDRFGHQVGDLTIKTVAATLERLRRRGDVVGRYGGEEFVMLLPNTELSAAASVAERMREAIAALRLQAESETYQVTVSLGVSALRLSRDMELQQAQQLLLHTADLALYQAKDQGRNQVCQLRP